jgi:hypothetical protein
MSTTIDLLLDLYVSQGGKVSDLDTTQQIKNYNTTDGLLYLINKLLKGKRVQPLGYRFKDYFDRLTLGTNYTQVGSGATYTCDGTKLTISGGDGTPNNNYIYRNNYATNCEDFTVRLRYKINVLNATSYGLGIKLIDGCSNTTVLQSFLFHLISATGSFTGKPFKQYQPLGTFTTYTDQVLTIAANDIIDFKLRFNKHLLYVTWCNETTGQVIYEVHNMSVANATPPYIGNTNKFGIYINGGTYDVLEFSVYSQTPKNADAVLLGDSISAGAFAGSISKRYLNLLAQNDRQSNYVAYARGGGLAVDMASALILSEIVELNAKRYFFALGFNDKAFGRSNAQIVADITTIKNAVEAIGAEVILLSIIANPSLNTAIKAAFPNTKYIDYNTALCNAAGDALADAYAGDAGHPNGPGNIVMSNIIESAIGDWANTYLVGYNEQ